MGSLRGLLRDMGDFLARGFRKLTSFFGRPVYIVGEPLPLIGHIAFGVLDRGTNVVQIRPTTICTHSCVFCSVDSGPVSKWRQAEFMVDIRWLYRHAVDVAEYKGGKSLEALLDGVGEPLSHPGVVELIRMLKTSGYFERIAVETHGGFLTKDLIIKLEEAGLDRINLSVDTTDSTQAKKLTGLESYDVIRILDLASWILENTRIDVVLTPVVIPGVNEQEMVKLIEWARKHRAGEKSGWPTGVLIQKYEVHKYGRKVKGTHPWSWSRFYEWLRGLEETTGYKLLVTSREIGIEPRPSLPKPFREGDIVTGIVLGPGWHKGEYILVDREYRRLISLFPRREVRSGEVLNVRIVRDVDNIYVSTL